MSVHAVPDRVGQYRVIKRIAYGGMAEVLLGELKGADGFSKSVVIKRILPQYGGNEGFITMFRDEARIMSRLHHGNIVQVIDFGEADGAHFLVLEYVNGASLRALLDALDRRGETLSVREVAHVAADVARALDYAHRKRGRDGSQLLIVHRDVSPANILVSREGEVKLADFGIARARSRITSTLEGAGVLKGKLAYMAPETVSEGETTPRSDLFSLGAVVYEMLIGGNPFLGRTEAETMQRVLGVALPPPSSIRLEVPREMDEAVLHLLERDPEARPDRGLKVAASFANVAAGQGAPSMDLLAGSVNRLVPHSEYVTPSTRPSRAPARRTVLVVDESRTMRAVLKTTLAARFDVLEASSAVEALSLLRGKEPLAAVVCQRKLPDTTGVELCKNLRGDSELGELPFVLLVADMDSRVLADAKEVGIDAVVPKQADAATVLERVRLAIGARAATL